MGTHSGPCTSNGTLLRPVVSSSSYASPPVSLGGRECSGLVERNRPVYGASDCRYGDDEVLQALLEQVLAIRQEPRSSGYDSLDEQGVSDLSRNS